MPKKLNMDKPPRDWRVLYIPLNGHADARVVFPNGTVTSDDLQTVIDYLTHYREIRKRYEEQQNERAAADPGAR